VRLLGASTGVLTNDAGEFRLIVSVQGSVTVVLRKLGYNPVGVPLEIAPNDSLHIATRLARAPQTLDTLRIAGKSEPIAAPRHAGFELRRQLNRGTFITPEQLERTASTSIGDVLRGLPGIKVNTDNLGMLAIESTRGMRLDRSGRPVPCRVRVMVDGFLMPLSDTPMPVTSPKALHGIEVYSGPATIPRELIRGGEDVFCGLVAIWTK
jgi:outer membrane receptor for Fe3+-dicitrate